MRKISKTKQNKTIKENLRGVHSLLMHVNNKLELSYHSTEMPFLKAAK